jgi:FKBP-type peptidyl-prolyl cis-trans isomerase
LLKIIRVPRPFHLKNICRGWKVGQVDLDTDWVSQGLKAALAGRATLITEVEMSEALTRFGQALKAHQQHRDAPERGRNPQPGILLSGNPNGPFKTQRDLTSYAFGMDTGRAWKAGQLDLVSDMVVQGLKDAVANCATLLSDAEMNDTMARFGREQRSLQQHRREQVAEENRRQGEACLEENKAQPGVVSLPSGLQYKILTQGKGPNPELANWVKLKYCGTRIDGTVFESSAAHPEASVFGLGSITQGWAEALQMMKPGDRWQLFVPSSLAYGKDGAPGIGPDETIIYDLELVSILPGQPPPTAEDLASERGLDGD